MTSILGTTRRLARPALFLAISAALAACGSDSNGPTGLTDASGTYTLGSVSGNGLPYTVPNSNTSIVITHATAVLDNGNYDIDGEGSDFSGPGRIIADHGTYVLTGSTITFHSSEFGEDYTAPATTTGYVATTPGAFLNSTTPSFTFTFVKSN